MDQNGIDELWKIYSFSSNVIKDASHLTILCSNETINLFGNIIYNILEKNNFADEALYQKSSLIQEIYIFERISSLRIRFLHENLELLKQFFHHNSTDLNSIHTYIETLKNYMENSPELLASK